MNKLQIEINDISGSVKFDGITVPGVKSVSAAVAAQDCSMVTLEVFAKDCDIKFAPKLQTAGDSES